MTLIFLPNTKSHASEICIHHYDINQISKLKEKAQILTAMIERIY